MGLKILHSADWHLDSPFGAFSEDQRQFLRQQQRQLPERITRLCREERCDMVLLAGDLFDGPYSRDTADLVAKALGECGVPVFISPGNHDYYGPNSPWSREKWPSNVYIFRGGLRYVDVPELNCRVYGAGYDSMDCPGLLQDFHAQGNLRYHIGVLHGDATQSSSPYCPITAAQIAESGLDYLALGHIHKVGGFWSKNTLCAWPGCPMGRGWDETGAKGAYIVTLEDSVRVQPVDLGTVCFWDLKVEEDGDVEPRLAEVLPAAAAEDFYRVTISGHASVDMQALERKYSHLPHLTLRDRTTPETAPWSRGEEDSLRGMFFQMLQDAEKEASPEEAKRIRLAGQIAGKLLEGREVTLP